MEIKYSEKAVKQMHSIAKSDKISAVMILEKIERYSMNPDQFPGIKKLKGKYATFKRLRAGNYRIIFDDE